MKLLFTMPGGTELIIILIIVVIFFGGRKIPELMKGIGNGIREYKDGLKKVNDITKNLNDNQ